MAGKLHVFDFLEENPPSPLPHIVAVFGDDAFLKRLALERIQQAVGTHDDFAVTSLVGKESGWADVHDQLATRSLFSNDRQLVIVRDADPFVTAHRGQLEDYSAAANQNGILLLEVKTWPGNTRLAKSVAKQGTAVECKLPQKGRSLDTQRLFRWLTQHASGTHRLKLSGRQTEKIFELVGDELGLIDCELAKLALFADDNGKVTDEQIDDVVGGWRTQTTWVLLDAVCSGDAAEALRQIDQLFHAGEHPLALFGAFSWSLRRMAAAVRIVAMQERQGRKPNLTQALVEAGVSEYPRQRLEKAVKDLRQIGRDRGGRLYRQLLEADLKLKRSHAHATRGRLVLEQLILALSTDMNPRKMQVPA